MLPLFNVAVTASIRTTGHYISFAVTGTMMLLTVAFVAYQSKRRNKMTKLKKWGPTIITACAAFFVIADPLRTIILDSNVDVCCITEFTGDQCVNAGNASTYYTSNQSLSTGQYAGVTCPTDSWYPYLGKYHIACVGGDVNNEAPKCLNAVGIVFTYAITYTGFLLLAIGTLWNANIVKKLREIRSQWRSLRASRPTRP